MDTGKWLIEIAVSAGASLILTVILGFIVIPILRKFKLNQPLSEVGPAWHQTTKSNTPTMGGLCFVVPFLLVCAGFFIRTDTWDKPRIGMALAVAFAFLNSVIGFIDDAMKLKKKKNEGLKSWQKFIMQAVITAAFLAGLTYFSVLPTSLAIPFTQTSVDLGFGAYIVYELVIVGFINATNITDGLDGLASSICLIVCLAGLFIAYRHQDVVGHFIPAAVAGGMIGFLVFNHFPAKVFMGDTGSLFIGAALMGYAVISGTLLWFLLAGFVFIFEMITSLIQIVSIRCFHGHKVFKIAPFHHHLEKCDWKEPVIVLFFDAITIILCVLAAFA